MSAVLITGASRGIGLEFARQYAEAGESVVATCRDPERADRLSALASEHENLRVLGLDIVSDASIDGLIQELSGERVLIDCLISNAAILENELFGNWIRNKFTDTFNVNIAGPALLAQSIDSVLSDSAKVVQLSSGLGSLEWGGEGMSDGDSYSMSKAALNMLTVRLASAFRGTSRCVVSISPGWVQTDMGGSSASLTVEDSVSRMIPTIELLTASDSGRFIDNQGNTLPW